MLPAEADKEAKPVKKQSKSRHEWLFTSFIGIGITRDPH
jgi:hypothetical protein